MSDPDLSLVIACYNEAEHLEHSVRTLEATLRLMCASHELIFIDDCSRDATPDILRRLERDRSGHRFLYHARNVGRGGTVTEGLMLARGRVAGYLDIDLEIPPCFILSAMAALLEGGCDAVVARRIYKLHLTPFALSRHFAHYVYRWMAHRVLPVPVADSEAGFKFFRRERILPVLSEVRDRAWFWDTEVLVRAHRAGLCIAEVPCLYVRNLEKTSTVRLIPDTLKYLRAARRLRRQLTVEPASATATTATAENGNSRVVSLHETPRND